MCVLYRGNVSREPLLSNNTGIFTEALSSNDKGIFTDPLPSNDGGIFTDPLPSIAPAFVWLPTALLVG
jgi:hypothetical protein